MIVVYTKKIDNEKKTEISVWIRSEKPIKKCEMKWERNKSVGCRLFLAV